MGLVQSPTRRPEGTYALSAPPGGRIGPSGLKRHAHQSRRTWAPSFARRLYTGTNQLLEQPNQSRTLSAALALTIPSATTFHWKSCLAWRIRNSPPNAAHKWPIGKAPSRRPAQRKESPFTDRGIWNWSDTPNASCRNCSRLLKMPASGVLASLRGSTIPEQA